MTNSSAPIMSIMAVLMDVPEKHFTKFGLTRTNAMKLLTRASDSLDEYDHLVSRLDQGDEDDEFGTEGWRHTFGFE